MDYCHQCRRHLNGALACAGCGTPAHELRRDPAGGREDPGGRSGYGVPEPAPARGHGTGSGDVDADVDADVIELGEVSWRTRDGRDGGEGGTDPGARPVPGGGRSGAGERGRGGRRAASRGRTRTRPGGRRARSRRGRNVIVGVLGLVLAGGALSLTELAREGDGSARVKEKDLSRGEPLPAPEAPEEGTVPDEPDAVTGRPSEHPGSRGSGRPTATATATGTGAGTRPGPSPSRVVTAPAAPHPGGGGRRPRPPAPPAP
ncbi:hypothetical protein, partial [Streptomyces sp. NPDC058953]|uniref:SCO2400 family protein n=1 Tax=Streptomyces sp. NPDC058953 TaxID=3346676 RepID=UPI0036783389